MDILTFNFKFTYILLGIDSLDRKRNLVANFRQWRKFLLMKWKYARKKNCMLPEKAVINI